MEGTGLTLFCFGSLEGIANFARPASENVARQIAGFVGVNTFA